MTDKFSRKGFLKLGGGVITSVLASSLVSTSVFGQDESVDVDRSLDTLQGEFDLQLKEKYAELITLDANPPKGTKAVRYFIDDIRVSELTNLYAVQTNTKPVWKTVTDPAWFESGVRNLSIEADTPEGTISLGKRKINIPKRKKDESTISLSGAWKFATGDDLKNEKIDTDLPNVARIDFDDKKWETVLVPNSLGCINQKWNNPEGIIGVYRKTIDLKHPQENEQISLTLKSCYWLGRVFVNGTEVGQTKGGYLPTRFDITNSLRSGKNLITVIVDNRKASMGLFKTLHVFYWNWGGLLQEVHVKRNPDVALIDLRAEGSSSGVLRLFPTAVNKKSIEQKIDLEITVYDPAGNKVLGPKRSILALPGGVNGDVLTPIELKVKDPQLWDLGQPRLYTVVVNGKWGRLIERTGFRDIEVKAGDMLLNGKAIENLQGFNRHADYPGLGRTQLDKLQYEELKDLYDRGFRIFRPGHYPTTPALLDAADELGMLVIEEINVTGFTGPQLDSKEIKDFAAQQLTKMIHRDRSHPSIIAWSIGNENLTDDEKSIPYVRDTIGLGRSLDPSRLFTHVTWKAEKDITYQYQDFVSQNYYAAWYSEKVEDAVKLFDDIQAKVNKPVMLTEYGAEAVTKDGFGKGSEFYQSYLIDSYNRLLDSRKHFIAKLYWTSTEFWCRPEWDGGSPIPVPPFHCKALKSYYRNETKLGWRTIFSPVRLSLAADNPTVQKDLFGGIIKVPARAESEIKANITLSELKGKEVRGTLVVVPSLGFDIKRPMQSVLQSLAPGMSSSGVKAKDKLPFILAPNETKIITVELKGKLPEELNSTYCLIKAIIDDETEAHPLILTVTH